LHIGPFFLIIGDSLYCRPEDEDDEEEEPRPTLLRRTTIGNGMQFYMISCSIHLNFIYLIYIILIYGDAVEPKLAFLLLGPPDSVLDWTKEADIALSDQNDMSQAYSRKNWRLLRCQNGKFRVPLHQFLALSLRACTLSSSQMVSHWD
jgi:hypothetical protein